MTSLQPPHASPSDDSSSFRNGNGRVKLSRSPHPYHRRSTSLASKELRPDINELENVNFTQRPSTSGSSDSGTEADDERGILLKGLPAPPLRAHKGLRGSTPFAQSPAISPLPTPPLVKSEHRTSFFVQPKSRATPEALDPEERRQAREKYTKRKRAEIVQRITETCLLLGIGVLVSNAGHTAQELAIWRPELVIFGLAILSLYSIYPLRLTFEFSQRGHALEQSFRRGFHIPSKFDPGSLLYPVLLPCIVTTSLLPHNPAFLLPNLILGLSSIPSRLIPFAKFGPDWSLVQWAVSVTPLLVSRASVSAPYALKVGLGSALHPENLALLCPLQKALLPPLEYLTTTSLDPSELQLLATGLIDLLLFATTPQMQILKSLLWVGGIALFVTCSHVMGWEVALARVPSWKFAKRRRSPTSLLGKLDYKICQLLAQPCTTKRNNDSSEDEEPVSSINSANVKKPKLNLKVELNGSPISNIEQESQSAVELCQNGTADNITGLNALNHRRNTFPEYPQDYQSPKKKNSRRRPKRSTSPASSSFLSLSPAQAIVRKWAYAIYVYIAVLTIVLVPIRRFVGLYALSSHEPFGWAIGYLLGNLPEFRFFVVSNNIEKWIRLPSRVEDIASLEDLGWLELFRQTTTGPATTRLFICSYCCTVLLVGIAIVLRLTSVVEVDTRRKVFHGIMVAMLLPTVFVDPCFIALALVLILAIFLLLDLFRASQLPPISKPLTHFLAPYVDGRDHRGPVIVSHIFLLIGCAIPLWLSLVGTARTGLNPWSGWEVQHRDVSMISGVVCVGMGDAAASLIGRRYGKTKWYWGGGKSLEGSVAFAIAATIGLMASYTWLRVGGWVKFEDSAFLLTLGKCAVAGMGASLMESTLTAANDNVVVPLGLWLLVRGLDI